MRKAVARVSGGLFVAAPLAYRLSRAPPTGDNHMIFRALALCAALCACSPVPPAKTPAEAAAPAVAMPAGFRLDNLASGARLTSPAKITGVAPNDWYFEAVFQARLIGADGKVIAEAPAQAQTDWTTPGPVPFAATFAFDVPADTPATLMLAEDMYGGEDHPGSTKVMTIPVVLAATRP